MADRTRWIARTLQQHEGPLVRYARSLVGDLETARDLVQDCFVRLCRERPERLNGHVAQWLFTVCRNRAIDHLRREGRMQALDGREPETRDDPAARAEGADECGKLRRCLASLPARQREVLRLKFQEGLSYKQIGAVTKTSVSNVGFLLHTALKTLRARFDAPGSAS